MWGGGGDYLDFYDLPDKGWHGLVVKVRMLSISSMQD